MVDGKKYAVELGGLANSFERCQHRLLVSAMVSGETMGLGSDPDSLLQKQVEQENRWERESGECGGGDRDSEVNL